MSQEQSKENGHKKESKTHFNNRENDRNSQGHGKVQS